MLPLPVLLTQPLWLHLRYSFPSTTALLPHEKSTFALAWGWNSLVLRSNPGCSVNYFAPRTAVNLWAAQFFGELRLYFRSNLIYTERPTAVTMSITFANLLTTYTLLYTMCHECSIRPYSDSSAGHVCVVIQLRAPRTFFISSLIICYDAYVLGLRAVSTPPP